MSSCPVCIEKLTEKNQVVCHIQACAYTCCKKCVQTYLLNTTLEPHCMHCRTKWNNEFIKTSLGKTFITSQYKTHRAKVLADQIIARKEEYLENAALYKENLADKVLCSALNEEVSKIRQEYEAKYAELDNIRSRIRLRTTRLESRQAPAAESQKLEKNFKMPCQNSDCHGMLDSSYFCLLCAKKTCKDCLTVIEPNHVCNPDTVATAALIKSSSKPCPKCGERISKIDGCDQMWCVECKTAFSWNTGNIETGTVHNPHYYQWMRENGGMQRTDAPVACCNNGHLNIHDITFYFGKISAVYNCCISANKLTYMQGKPVLGNINEIVNPHIALLEQVSIAYKQLTEYKSYIDHITNVILPDTMASLERKSENHDIVYEYLIGIKNRENLGNALVAKEENEIKINACNDILNATQMVLTQILQTFLNNIPETSPELINLRNALQGARFDIEINNNENSYYYKRTVETNTFIVDKFYNKIKNDGIAVFTAAANILLDISKPAIQSATKYLAYSNIEQIKMLTIHNSKRKLWLWNFEKHTREDVGFKNKGEMQAAIETYSAFL